MTTITIIGLGEAGRLYAGGLRTAGAQVRGYDPYAAADLPGIDRVAALGEAVAGADLVLSLVGANAAETVAAEALPLMSPPAVFADLNTGSPDMKARIASRGAAHAIAVADVAVLAPVPRAAERTPLLASGPGAERFAALVSPLGVPVDTTAGQAGDAARLKLVRSVFMKGLAALVIETLGAARAAGAEDWMRGQLVGELGPDGDALVARLVEGTYAHAVRREHEVRDVLAMLDAAGQPADMTRGTLAWFERIVAERG